MVFCIVVMIMGGLRLCATAADQSSAALGIPMPYIYSCLLVGAFLFIFYALIFIWEDVKELRIYRGQCAAGCPREKQNPSAHPADASKNENGRNDIS
ncbi:MAG: TRAP transporter small permease subunit [Clostridioides difficile]